MNDDFDDAGPVNVFTVAEAPAPGGAVAALQKREETEAFAMVMMAKRFPRNQKEALDRILIAFQRKTLAEQSQYQFSRGGQDIVGPSIRAAEAVAQEWGNLDTGWRELSRGVNHKGVPYSEVMAYCTDLQSTTRKSLHFIVPHWRDKKNNQGYVLKDERDIYEVCANMAQRRLRACILAMVPGDVMEQAMRQAAATLNAHADTSPEGIKKMVEAFAPFGVTQEHIEKRIQRRLDSITAAQIVGLKRIYQSLRDDMSAPWDWFDMPPPEKVEGKTTSMAELKAKAGEQQGEAAAPPPPAATGSGRHAAAAADRGRPPGPDARRAHRQVQEDALGGRAGGARRAVAGSRQLPR
jgi:hypothetical protein